MGDVRYNNSTLSLTSTLDLGGWSMTRSGRFSPGKKHEGVWASRPFWTSEENLGLTGIRTLNLQTRSKPIAYFRHMSNTMHSFFSRHQIWSPILFIRGQLNRREVRYSKNKTRQGAFTWFKFVTSKMRDARTSLKPVSKRSSSRALRNAAPSGIVRGIDVLLTFHGSIMYTGKPPYFYFYWGHIAETSETTLHLTIRDQRWTGMSNVGYSLVTSTFGGERCHMLIEIPRSINELMNKMVPSRSSISADLT